MTSQTRLLLILGLVAVLTGAALLALSPGERETVWLTDGGSIRVRATDQTPRRVLWTPARPVRAETGVDEYEPKISADGTTMVLVRRKPGQNADLFTSRWTPRGWTEPEGISDLNTEHEELGPELSFDGDSLYFYSDRPGGLGGYDLWVSRAGEGRWGTPVNLGPAVNSTWNDYGPALSSDGAMLLFSSNRPRADEPAPRGEAWDATIRERRQRHDYDLYSTRISAGEPAAAEPISTLNTTFDEGAPALSPAGDFLYFASDRPGGIGGFDLYRARIRGGYFDPIERLGDLVNSSDNDLDPGLSADGFRLFFSSDRPAGQVISAQAEPVPSDPARYALWFSSSREVYDEIEKVHRQAWVWTLPWKWLALLIAALAPLALLLWLLRKEDWRHRFARLSLFAQCLIVSLLLHVLLASLLAVWRVGSGIADMVRDGGGGTRVILGNADAVGSGDGSIESQLLGSVVSLDLPNTAFVSAPPPESPSIESSPVSSPLPPLASGPTTPITLAEVPLTSPGPSPRVVALAPATSAPVGVTPATPDRPLPVTEGADLPLVQGTSAPVRGGPVATSPVQVDLRPLAAPGGAAPAMVTATGESAPAVLSPIGDAPTPAPEHSLASSSAIPTSAPASATPAGVEGGSPGTGAPAVPSISAPTLGSSMNSASVHVTPAPSATNRSAGTGRLEIGSTESPAGATSPIASRTPVPIRSIPAPAAAIPRTPTGRGGTSAGDEHPLAATVPSMRSLVPTISPGSTTGSERVAIDLPRRGTPLPAGADLGQTFATSGSSEGVPAGVSIRGGTSDILPPTATAATPTRLPRLPAEPVTPVETFAQRAPEVRGEVLQRSGGSNETEKAVGLALEWFSRNQESDGRWSSRKHGGEIDADAAMTGMALLCYLGAGHTHLRDGPYRSHVEKALNWLRSRQDSSGDLRRGETMYGQTVATVALCEALAMTGDQSLAEPARAAVDLVLARATGERAGNDRDTSVIGWLVFTVESARRAGIDVPANVFDAAGRWLTSVTEPGSPGRYSYRRGEPASAAMTAEAMFVQQLLGHSRDERAMQESARFILRTPPRWTDGAPTHYWYYATLALFQHQGDEWKQWNEALVRELLAHQQRDDALAGSWAPKDQWSQMGGRVYQTAVCTLSLEVYYRYRAK